MNLGHLDAKCGIMFFFVDIEGHADDDSVKKALSELEEHAAMVRLLGSYPRAVL